MTEPKAIEVLADWEGLAGPLQLGLLYPLRSRGSETFEFELWPAALSNPVLRGLHLDPRLGLFEGRQHPPQGTCGFGVFSDSSPDRWGRLLMDRRLEREKRAGRASQVRRLFESDYLLGVHDSFRSGALRYRLQGSEVFLDNQFGLAAPPIVRLRELEAACLAIENDETNTAPEGDAWLRQLIAPGGSLGGARPKASIEAPDGTLWIAKFPSLRDEHDVGAWELVVHSLAARFGLRVPESAAKRFARAQHTFLVRRFDRTAAGARLHFASAMTLTGSEDGADASSGASYLELAEVLMAHGSQTNRDLLELWSRVVFNLLVSNTDDHLRNHGFLLEPGKGWRLSDAYDMNPVPYSGGLKLNISESDNALDLDLARSVAGYFRVQPSAAEEIIARGKAVVRSWAAVATRLGIPHREIERLAPAFTLAT